MVGNDNILYLINIKTMKILKQFYLTYYPGEIVFIYKIEDNIYICKENFLILFKYVENQLLFSIFENNSNNLLIFNYLNNLFLEKQYPKLHKTIIINCIKNEISRCGCGKSTLINIILKMETSPVPYLGPFPFVCLQDEDYRPKIKNKYEKKYLKKNVSFILMGPKKIGKNDLRTEKIKKREIQLKKYNIIYQSQKFKKKYR